MMRFSLPRAAILIRFDRTSRMCANTPRPSWAAPRLLLRLRLSSHQLLPFALQSHPVAVVPSPSSSSLLQHRRYSAFPMSNPSSWTVSTPLPPRPHQPLSTFSTSTASCPPSNPPALCVSFSSSRLITSSLTTGIALSLSSQPVKPGNSRVTSGVSLLSSSTMPWVSTLAGATSFFLIASRDGVEVF
jgi:hypothetical protein